VNIGPAPENGVTLPLVKTIINIPGVTVPDVDVLIVLAVNVNTVPEVIPVLFITKFGFIVNAVVVYALYTAGVPVVPVKKPLGAAVL
jgi:hypothetical protein